MQVLNQKNSNSNENPDNRDEILLGEVVETSLTHYVAQSFVLDQSPPFGGLVRVKDRSNQAEIFGAVAQIVTGGIDTGRRAIARSAGRVGQADEQVYEDNPQLNRLLITTFEVAILGWKRLNQDQTTDIIYVFPDYPPPLHYSVALCSNEQLIAFTSKSLFLRALLAAPIGPGEELVAAVLRRGAQARGSQGHAWLVDTGRALARLLKEDYERLRTILEKCGN